MCIVVLSGTRRIGKLTAELSATLSPRRFFHESITDKNALFCAVTHKWTHTLNSLTVNTILKSEGSGISSEVSGTVKSESRYGLAADWFPWSMVAFRSVHLVLLLLLLHELNWNCATGKLKSVYLLTIVTKDVRNDFLVPVWRVRLFCVCFWTLCVPAQGQCSSIVLLPT